LIPSLVPHRGTIIRSAIAFDLFINDNDSHSYYCEIGKDP
jgi:hypothetical protein